MIMKRILCVLLVLVVALSVCVFGANAAEAYEYTDKYGITYYYAFYEENGSTKALMIRISNSRRNGNLRKWNA